MSFDATVLQIRNIDTANETFEAKVAIEQQWMMTEKDVEASLEEEHGDWTGLPFRGPHSARAQQRYLLPPLCLTNVSPAPDAPSFVPHHQKRNKTLPRSGTRRSLCVPSADRGPAIRQSRELRPD